MSKGARLRGLRRKCRGVMKNQDTGSYDLDKTAYKKLKREIRTSVDFTKKYGISPRQFEAEFYEIVSLEDLNE